MPQPQKTQGENEDIIDLFEYVHDSDKGHDNPLVGMINKKVIAERNNDEEGAKYMIDLMKYWDSHDDGVQEGLERGMEQGLERGLEQGEDNKLINQVYRKMQKGQTVSEISEDLLEDEAKVQRIYDAISRHREDFNARTIYEEVFEKV